MIQISFPKFFLTCFSFKPCTAIFPSEKLEQIDDATLGPDGELQIYLDGLEKAADVPAYVKEHPFEHSAITTIHPDCLDSKGKESSASGKVMSR